MNSCENYKCPHRTNGKCNHKRATDVEKCKRRIAFLNGTYEVKRYKNKNPEAV